MLTPGDWPLGPVDCESTQTKRGRENKEQRRQGEAYERIERYSQS